MTTIKSVPKLPARDPGAHKNDFGHVAVVAGSTGMTGAAALACTAALRTGAGLVTLGIPKSLNAILEMKLTEVMTRPLPETAAGSLAASALPEIRKMLKAATVLAIGPGLSMHRSTAALARKLLKSCRLPMVVDADALGALAGTRMAFGGRAVLTPHPGEFARLTGKSKAAIEADREGAAAACARARKAVVVLKGHRTVVTDGTRLYENQTGNSGMATAGSGDVLTGIIAGGLAQGMEPFAAAIAGVYLHGLAGDAAARALGAYSLIASDILNALPEAILRANRR